jgi:hypothetical protein
LYPIFLVRNFSFFNVCVNFAIVCEFFVCNYSFCITSGVLGIKSGKESSGHKISMIYGILKAIGW